MKLGTNDIAILKALLQDGRASLREIAKKTSLTTPTVSHHYSRMIKSGLIKKFAPVLDQGMVGHGVNAFVTLRSKVGDTTKLSKKLSAIDEISGLFVTTGENNITLRVSCADTRELQDLVNVKLPRITNGEVISSQIIVDIVKDEQPLFLSKDISVRLSCDFCKGEIASDRPYNIKVGSTYHYFCCRTCRRSYLEKYDKRIKSINAKQTV